MGKFLKFAFFLCPLTLLVLWGCVAAAGQGPQAWIDYPLHNANLPLAPVNILAHASHNEGVSGMKFFVNGEEIASIDLQGRLLEDATVEWKPPTQGIYTLEVLGVNTAGEPGGRATAVVTIGKVVSETLTTPEISETHTITPSPSATIVTTTPTNTPTPTEATATYTPETPPLPSQPAATANQDANCRAGPATTFQAIAYLLQGQQALITGRLADSTWLLVLPPESSTSCWIAASVVSVSGNLEGVSIILPPPEPVTDTPTLTPTTPVPDTIKPTVQSLSLNPETIMRQTSGCPSYARTTTSIVIAVDNVGISYVTASWTLRDITNVVVESGSVNYTRADDRTFLATFGPVDESGTLTINGTVVDPSGNSTIFRQQLTVIDCIG